jgi:hypothetical protein
VITCPKCSKENQDHYKFCLGCGAELPRDAAPKPFSPKTPPQGVKVVANPLPAAGRPASPAPTPAPAPIAAAAPAPAPVSAAPKPQPAAAAAAAAPASAGGATVACPQCGHINQPSNTFCGACGFRLGGAAPKPVSVQPPGIAAATGTIVLTALRADGSEAGTYTIPQGPEALVGRDTGGIFASDSYLSPKHALFRMKGVGKLTVQDQGSLNGVYRKLAPKVAVELEPSDVFRIGQEIVKFESI